MNQTIIMQKEILQRNLKVATNTSDNKRRKVTNTSNRDF